MPYGRAREDAKIDHLRARHRLSKWLLRHEIRPAEKTKLWSSTHRRWLDGAQALVFQEYLDAIDEIEGRISRLEAEIHVAAVGSVHAPVIQALQTLRGVAEVTAATLVAEVGEFSRVSHPAQLMAYAGVVPKEYSSGSGRWQGGITKVGNAHLRTVAVEAAWPYRYRPALKGDIKKRQEGQDARVRDIAWRAQHRLHGKFMRLMMRGKRGWGDGGSGGERTPGVCLGHRLYGRV